MITFSVSPALIAANIWSIVSNFTSDEMAHLQPEIRHEPASALDAGTDGLLFYRGITLLWKQSLHPGGLLAFEIGEQQGEDVSGILRQHGFTGIRVIQDYAHHDRVVIGNVPESTH